MIKVRMHGRGVGISSASPYTVRRSFDIFSTTYQEITMSQAQFLHMIVRKLNEILKKKLYVEDRLSSRIIWVKN